MSVRVKAFGVHLLTSAVIALAVVALVFGLWYPAPLAAATGVTGIFLILLIVDVCLGPLLTLLVYKEGKKTLVMDLTIIVLLQLGALGYGVYTVAEGRPAWLVFSVDRFELVRINDIDERKLDEAAKAFKTPSWFGPQWVAAHNPADADARNTLMFEAIMGGTDISARPNLYVPVNEQWQNIQNRAQELTKLAEFNTNAALEAELGNDWQVQPYTWLPLKANNQDMVVLVGEQGKVIEIIDLRPWGK